MPMRVPAMRLSCEGGKWFTSEAPYNADNVCFPEGNYVMLNPQCSPPSVLGMHWYRGASRSHSRFHLHVFFYTDHSL